MKAVLGIDTGGTYTDAALVDHETGAVLTGAKTLTTRHDLSVGIARAVAEVLERGVVSPAEIHLVALSTTLATNSIVEGQGRPVGLVLIGYDRDLMRQYDLEGELATGRLAYVDGGHDVVGDEALPLDEDAAREVILAWRDEIEGLAVSAFFGVYNPAHELRVKAIAEELTDVPVTCGHELSTRLDSVRRATTAALNAQLIPLLRELATTVGGSLDDAGIHAPLMMVKGDGSLVRAEWAMERPIETILSGPAASVVGAWYLAGRRDVWTVDVGGTTTDIAALQNGRPILNPRGARVGGWRTMVEAADAHTIGLGGDSYVSFNGTNLVIGPQRVIPLCLLATEHPGVVDKLRMQEQTREGWRIGEFVVLQRRDERGLSEDKISLLRSLASGPRLVSELAEVGALVGQWIKSLETQQLVLRSGFTPTDALHALGTLDVWNPEPSRIGARMLARQVNLEPEAFCRLVIEGVSDRVTKALVTKVLSDEGTLPRWEQEQTAEEMLNRALGRRPDSNLGCQVRLRHPIVAIGAPVEAYMPRTAAQLHTGLVIPPYAEVANAVGAVTGSVVQQMRVTIQPVNEDQFRLHLPDGVYDFPTLDAAVCYAEKTISERIDGTARQAGAEHVEVRSEREDTIAPVQGDRIYLGTEIVFTAVGRPRLAE